MSSLDQQAEEIFSQLKPICVQLIALKDAISPGESQRIGRLLWDLLNVLENVRDPVLVLQLKLVMYIVAPLLQTFGAVARSDVLYDNVLEPLLRCLLFLLTETVWKASFTPKLQQELLILFTLCVDPPQPKSSPVRRVTSEEVKHMAIKCIDALLPDKNIGEEIHPLVVALRLEQTRPLVANTATALLDVIHQPKNISLRSEALDTLRRLLIDYLHDGSILTGFLPRVVSVLRRVICQKGEKENHQIIVKALQVLGDVIQAVLANEENSHLIRSSTSFQDFQQFQISVKDQEAGQKDLDSTTKNPDVKDEKGSRFLVERTQAWLTTTKRELKKNLERILKAFDHQDWRARIAFVRFSYQIISNCYQTLDNCVPLLLDTLLLCMDDDYPNVATECRRLTAEIIGREEFQAVSFKALQDGLHSWMKELPGCIISGNESDKIKYMALITAATLLLGEHSHSVLNEAIPRYSDAWLTALEIDTESLNVLEESGYNKYIELPDQETKSQTVIYPKVRFKYLVSDRAVGKLSRMLNVIGRVGDLPTWTDYFMRYIHNTDDRSYPEAIFIIHSLLSGASVSEEEQDGLDMWQNQVITDDFDDQEYAGASLDEQRASRETLRSLSLQIMQGLLECVIDPSSESSRFSSFAVSTRQNVYDYEATKVLSICLSLQTVGLLACIVGRQDMQNELITLLYPLLAHLGSPNIRIHSYALITLDTVALICGERSAKELCVANIDYVINMVSQRLSMLLDNPRAPLVLKALVRIGGSGAIAYLEDSVEEIFDALDRYHMQGWLCAQLCSVLTEIVQTLLKSADISHDDIDKDEHQSRAAEHGVSKIIQDFIAAQTQEGQEEEKEEEQTTLEEIGKYFLERQKKKEQEPTLEDLLEKEEQENQQVEEDEPRLPPEDTSPPLSKEQEMALDIMRKARHFLAFPSSQLRAEILSLLAAGVQLLRQTEDKIRVFVNDLWPQAVQRLSDPQGAVALNALHLVQILLDNLGDFMLRRFEDVWPKLKSLLKAEYSAATNSINYYYYSQHSYAYRLHLGVIQVIKTAASRMILREKTLQDIAQATKVFLDDRIPEDLQIAARQLYLGLTHSNADTVWLITLGMLGQQGIIYSESNDLKEFKLPRWMQDDSKTLRNNAKMILDSIP